MPLIIKLMIISQVWHRWVLLTLLWGSQRRLWGLSLKIPQESGRDEQAAADTRSINNSTKSLALAFRRSQGQVVEAEILMDVSAGAIREGKVVPRVGLSLAHTLTKQSSVLSPR